MTMRSEPAGSDTPAWVAEANCRGVAPDLFFPTRGDNAAIEAAREVCRGCSVTAECLEYALSTGQKFGVWAATTERQRRRMRRARRQAA